MLHCGHMWACRIPLTQTPLAQTVVYPVLVALASSPPQVLRVRPAGQQQQPGGRGEAGDGAVPGAPWRSSPAMAGCTTAAASMDTNAGKARISNFEEINLYSRFDHISRATLLRMKKEGGLSNSVQKWVIVECLMDCLSFTLNTFV